jgi:hypothetical protein
MSAPFIFTSGIFVVVLFLIGVIYTFKEFREMSEHPSDFRRDRSDEPKIIDQDK